VFTENQKIIVGLPLYNESGAIKELLYRIDTFMKYRKFDYTIVIYNDGSTDSSLEECKDIQKENKNIVILDGVVNKGLGVGLKELILFTLKNFTLNDVLVIMDSDNTHNPEHIFGMINKIRDGFDIVISSRYTSDSRIVGLTKFRELLSIGASYMFRILFPIRGVKDYTCGYRAYSISKLKEAYDVYGNNIVTEVGFTCMAELLVKLRTLNILASEVPLVLRYDRKVTSSKMKILKTIIKTFKLAMKKY